MPHDGELLPCSHTMPNILNKDVLISEMRMPMNPIDPAGTAGLVTREVRSGSRDGSPTKVAIARRTYPTDQADLWDVLTNAERIARSGGRE